MFGSRKTKWTHKTDVLVIGSGAAGLTAAIFAREAGASVMLVEKSDRVGGTTAVSGGVVWVPNNHAMRAAGIDDSPEDAVTYMTRIADGRSEAELIARFVEAAPEMARLLEEKAGIEFSSLTEYPDYHPEFEGGKKGGRSLETGLFDTTTLGPWASKLRRSPIFGGTPMTVAEATSWGVFSDPLSLPYRELGERFKRGVISSGAALVGRLLGACLARGTEPALGVAARELIVEDGAVVGLRAERGLEELLISAKGGVILATGGFEWNGELTRRFLGGVVTHPNSPPIQQGDGLRMAMAVGADLANLSEAWWCPSVSVPGEESDGRPLHRGDFAIRSLPHSIIVNRRGQRFVNEAQNYNDLMKPFFTFDPVAYERPNLPAWLIVNHAFVERYILVTSVPGMPVPEWIARDDSLEALAGKIGVDARGLGETVRRFNGFVERGADEDFHRGDSAYDRFYGDRKYERNPNLGALAKAPFYALEVHPGAIGTKGGPRTTADAEVLAVEGRPIRGLYAAGNVTSAICGAGYPGAGATIGCAMAWGMIAGRRAARRG